MLPVMDSKASSIPIMNGRSSAASAANNLMPSSIAIQMKESSVCVFLSANRLCAREWRTPQIKLCRADIFTPKSRIPSNEFTHHLNAGSILNDDDRDSARTEQLLFTRKRPIFSDNDFWNAIEKDRSGAHRTGR